MVKEFEDGDILEYTVSPMRAHLCQALDMYFLSSEEGKHAWSWAEKSNFAMSSVMHAFCAFETHVNETGHLMFFHPPSPIYVAPEQRPFLLRKVVSGWGTASCLDKYALIVEMRLGSKPSARHEAELRELNSLRNWIAHGFVFQRKVLLEANSEGNFDEADREDSVDWKKRFPNVKFSALGELAAEDAKKALLIAIEGLIATHQAAGLPLYFSSYYKRPTSTAVYGPDIAAEVLARHVATKERQEDRG